MQTAGVNYTAILLAGIAAWLVGALWYGVLARHWMAALETTKERLMGPSGKPSPGPYILSFIADLVIAFVLAGSISHLGPGQVTIRNGLISAVILWAGFVVTTMAVNNAYAKRKAMLTVIDAGHWLAAMLAAGLVIGWFGR